MLRMLVCGLAVVALGSSLLFARQGIVKTKDGMVLEGDVVEKPDAAAPGGAILEISGVPGKPGPVKVNKANLSEPVAYPDDVADEVHNALKAIDKNDVATRLKLARLAYDKHAYEAARDALDEAAKIDPSNKEVASLLGDVNKHIPKPATMPATGPAVATTNPAVPPKPKIPFGAFLAKRLVNPQELNHIKQQEWLSDDSKKMIVQIDPEIKRRFSATFVDVPPPAFNKLQPPEQALLILKNRPDLASGVTIKTDPATVLDFKKSVLQIVVRSCGSVGCHGSPKASGAFTLYLGSDPASTYTNFLTLQNYSMRSHGAQRSLIDRTLPESSLLLQFMLQPAISESPHPDVPGGKGTIRILTDTKYLQILRWIKSLDPKVPDYGIDLSVDAPPPPKK